ncbi:MAG: hypothetical protein QXT45_07820 [Candidatus Bilamarchaeaceae archaeon]
MDEVYAGNVAAAREDFVAILALTIMGHEYKLATANVLSLRQHSGPCYMDAVDIVAQINLANRPIKADGAVKR